MAAMDGLPGGRQRGSAGGGSRPDAPPLRMEELSRLADAMPPHALEAEVSLLGSMLLDPAVVSDIVG